MDPVTIALIAAAIGAAGSIGSAALSSNPKETKIQKQKRGLIEQLLEGVNGSGPFSNMFEMDDDSFQQYFVNPSKARFQNERAPQIQQSFIASGQQRGTGLDDALTRAGIDMDQLLNEQYGSFQQGAMNRKSNMIGQILGAGNGVPPGLSTGEKYQEGAAGYLSSGDDGFGRDISSILDAYGEKKSNQKTREQERFKPPAREGYEQYEFRYR